MKIAIASKEKTKESEISLRGEERLIILFLKIKN